MEAKPIKDKKGYFCLYDSDGDLCGSVNTEAGRAIIGRAFYHKVRTCRVCTSYEPEIDRERLLAIATMMAADSVRSVKKRLASRRSIFSMPRGTSPRRAGRLSAPFAIAT